MTASVGKRAPAPAEGTEIHDRLLTPLARLPRPVGETIPLIGFQDHLLRRFGCAELVRLEDGAEFTGARLVADEVWALVEGSAEFRLEDQRSGSPTRGAREVHLLDEPIRLLVPFGVRVRILARSKAAVLLRFMTHSETEDPPLPEA